MSSSVSRSSSRSAFTLLELLIVITIIAILSGLILMMVGKVQVAAKQAKAKSEVKQLEKAFVAYHDEYGEWPKGIMGYDNVADPETDWGVTGIEVGPDVASMLGGNAVTVEGIIYNDQGIAFYEGLANDPWRNPYKYMMDFNDDGDVQSQVTDNDNTIYAPGQSVIVWSRGVDGSDRESDGGYVDDVISWKNSRESDYDTTP
jgi:prepilin-type N-terminal cleavage/methylation domain-containing protein